MAAITRRLRKNAMLYQLNYDRRIHMPDRGPRFYQRLCDAWLKWGRNFPTPRTLVFAGNRRGKETAIRQDMFMRHPRERPVYISGAGGGVTWVPIE